MKMKNVSRLLAILLMLNAICLIGFAQKPAKWVAPDKYKTMKNPNAGDASTGKDLFAKHCKSCHGKDGLGDGPKAATLGASCGDFTAKEFQSQTDGEIFYKITTGRDKMPAFGKTISEDNDRWAIVNYLRKLK
ncbi:MAG: cytochrome c [Bacteroidetes bacterium]|nr:cytochrome c [Bacteroidota bacterium]